MGSTTRLRATQSHARVILLVFLLLFQLLSHALRLLRVEVGLLLDSLVTILTALLRALATHGIVQRIFIRDALRKWISALLQGTSFSVFAVGEGGLLIQILNARVQGLVLREALLADALLLHLAAFLQEFFETAVAAEYFLTLDARVSLAHEAELGAARSVHASLHVALAEHLLVGLLRGITLLVLLVRAVG